MKKLEYINSQNPALKKEKFPKGDLYSIGNCNLGWPRVAEILTMGDFPSSIRGGFAFIWHHEGGTIAAVDHLATHPLFFSENKISNIYHELLLATPNANRNPMVDYQLEFLGGQSFYGSETTYKEIKRILPNHYLKNGEMRSYFSPLGYAGDQKIDKGHFTDLVESKVKKLATNKNALLLSGGTDSTALAGIVKKLKLDESFEFVHIYSDTQPVTEAHVVHELSKQMNLFVTSAKVNFSGNILPGEAGRQFSFWVDNPFLAKRRAIIDARLLQHRIFTGELGDQLFGGPKNSSLLNYFLQSEKVSAAEIAALWINLSASYGRNCSTKPMPRLLSLFEEFPESKNVYEELRAHLADTFSSMHTKDALNRFMLLNLVVKGPYRTWAYSQDSLDWAHPFADWDIVDYVFSLQSSEKVKMGGMSKWLLLDAWQPFVSDIPWRIPKHGLGIPAIGKIRNPSRHLDY